MKKSKVLLSIFISFIVGCLCAWLLRGEIDKQFMMEGHFHIVSTASQNFDVVLKFPSGEYESFDLKSGGTYRFKQTDTGEGSITVVINGVGREQVGYVTSLNSIIVLTVGDNETGFSQIFPSLNTVPL
ncbi:hypothetical protein [Kangiella marina]|uniref:Uncharacterized protein n=1 Tax=Kangiella marina TaxID=1079178 RepID=A0ABP8IC11_9GAMM